MKVVAIVQARVGSTRLPNKVMKLINGVPVIEVLLRRLNMAQAIDQVVVATSEEPNNADLIQHVTSLGFCCEIGSRNDVLDRYLKTAEKHKAEVIVRITGDCPLVDPVLVDMCVKTYFAENVDYLSNNHPPTFPDGLDVEVFSYQSLLCAAKESVSEYDREHVTPYLRVGTDFSQFSLTSKKDFSNHRWTLDEPEDFQVILNIFNHFYPDLEFGWNQVLELASRKPELFSMNGSILRDEGSAMNMGQKLWRRAKRVIPGGNMLLSKRAELFLPNKWPSYFDKTKGCRVWDLENHEYIDVSLMGVGTNILGYSHPEVDEAVVSVVKKGNLSTLNCPEEVYLAEKLVDLHSWADMVRFARTGGEANAIAIRIARAATGLDQIAVCGYHGWHDWYLSANLNQGDGLGEHLLPGLEPNGVPKTLKDTVHTFPYNDFERLKSIVKNNAIGAIVMEVERNRPPENNFLRHVRNLATEKGIVLIFDECSSGFRETFGGLHLKYGIDPDIAMFGKALGNGYAITAVIGKREVMEVAQSTFISSTFWTERVGPAAALATLDVMYREKSWELITRIGKKVRTGWQDLAQTHSIPISFWGISAMPGFTINSEMSAGYKTLITQEMLKQGYLASTSLYACTEHSKDILDGYFSSLDRVFNLISQCENQKHLNSVLDGPVCHSGFTRLN
ncbi:MAG: aminotransferase class III-fold pyridoxal phosphate-dependent enzyme [Betaproteobacteria bacterium]